MEISFEYNVRFIRLSDSVLDTPVNSVLEELFNNTIYNKKTWEAWRRDPVLNNRLKLMANLEVKGYAEFDKLECTDLTIDSDLEIKGDLKTNKLTTNNHDVFDEIYPVGSIYISQNNISPETLFGVGNWERFAQGRTLVGVDNSDIDFNSVLKEGGEAEVSLSVSEIPSHRHYLEIQGTDGGESHRHSYETTNGSPRESSDVGSRTVLRNNAAQNMPDAWTSRANNNHRHQITLENKGGGASHNNLQPYVTVYMWRRIS